MCLFVVWRSRKFVLIEIFVIVIIVFVVLFIVNSLRRSFNKKSVLVIVMF